MKLFRLSVILMGLALSATMMAQGIIRHKTPVTPSSTKRQSAQPAASPAKQQAVAQLIGNMVHVQGGTFTMGAAAAEDYWNAENAKPAHQVTVRSFYICRYETTQALWQKVMGRNPSEQKLGGNHPVENITWNDIQAFIQKLNALTGKHYRLPTEAEWEYAARGGRKSGGYRYSGSNQIDDVAWYSDNTHDRHKPVGTKRPNELGLYDMSGNVFEFCGDGYQPYSADPQDNPVQVSAKGYHPLRGGSYVAREYDCRCSYRFDQSSDYSHTHFGFRLAMSE